MPTCSQIGLITLATREQELHLQRYKERVISRKQRAGLDRACRLAARWRQDRRAAPATKPPPGAAVSFTVTFRIARWLLHRRLGFTRWLAQELADRFERLLHRAHGACSSWLAFNQRQLSRCWEQPSATSMTLILGKRVTGIEQALAASAPAVSRVTRAAREPLPRARRRPARGRGYRDMLAEFDHQPRGPQRPRPAAERAVAATSSAGRHWTSSSGASS